ncbi:MAG: hypothetical protein ACWGNP_04560 [Candidatus Bathyarchaeia archaeon]
MRGKVNMEKDYVLHNEAVIARFINGEDFLDEPDHEYQKLSHDQRVIRDFVSGSGVFARD